MIVRRYIARFLLSAWMLLAGSFIAISVAAAPVAQDTATQTVTATLTATMTPTGQLTTTATLTPTFSPTATGGSTATATGIINPTLTQTQASVTQSTATATVISITPSGTSTGTPVEVEPSGLITGTVTLIPFPTITLVYPQKTPTDKLLAAPRQPGLPALSKDETSPTWYKLIRLWPVGLILAIWLLLVAWFIFVQRYSD